MLGFLFPRRYRRLKAENDRLVALLAATEIVHTGQDHELWKAKAEAGRALSLLGAKERKIAALKAEIRDLKRERDRAGRFAPCEK